MLQMYSQIIHFCSLSYRCLDTVLGCFFRFGYSMRVLKTTQATSAYGNLLFLKRDTDREYPTNCANYEGCSWMIKS